MAQISLRVDDNLKKNAEIIFNEIGLNMSTAINIFLKAVTKFRLNCVRIRFTVKKILKNSKNVLQI